MKRIGDTAFWAPKCLIDHMLWMKELMVNLIQIPKRCWLIYTYGGPAIFFFPDPTKTKQKTN